MPGRILHLFSRRLQEIEWTRKRMEALHRARSLRRRDIESVYEGLFLRAINAFEAFLESLFIEVMLGKAQFARRKVALRISTPSRRTLWEVLLQGESYLDWLPYKRTEERAMAFLKSGRPFTVLDNGDRFRVDQCVQVRNAIAHSSAHAARQFHKKVIGSLNLPASERTVAGFLRSIARTSPVFVRFQICMSDLAQVAARIATCRE